MKILTTVTAILISCTALAQHRLIDNTLDINYTATYKNTFSLRMSSRLSQNQGWALRGFTGGGAYNIAGANSRLSLTYDFWRGNELNAQIIQRYGLAFNTQNKYSNLSLSLYKIDTPNTPSGFAGRIDLNMKLGN